MSRPKPKVDPRELMEQTLQLISGELDHIQSAAKVGKLDEDMSAALVKYSDAVLKYVKDDIKQDDEDKRRLSKMSTEELAKLASELAEKAKKA